MQHTIIDIFQQDYFGKQYEPIYDCSEISPYYIMGKTWEAEECKEKRLILPLYEIEEYWKSSWNPMPKMKGMIETFMLSIYNQGQKKISNIQELGANINQDSHLLVSRNLNKYCLELGKLIFERRIIYSNILPENSIIVFPEPEMTGCLSIRESEGDHNKREIGAFIVKEAAKCFQLIE